MTKIGTIKYRLYQDNRKESVNKGKWYARAMHERTVEFDEFIQHMANHNTSFSRGIINGVLMDMLDCLQELLLDGKSVRFGELGLLSVGISTIPSDTAYEFAANKNVTGVHLIVRNTKTWSNAELRKKCKINELPKNDVDSSAPDSDDDGNDGD